MQGQTLAGRGDQKAAEYLIFESSGRERRPAGTVFLP